MPKRTSALETVRKIRLPLRSNVLDSIDLSLTPYLSDPISRIGNTKNQILGMIAPTQSGKTVFLQVAVADSILQDPGTMFYILPDRIAAEKNLDEKITKMIECSPALSAHKTLKVTDMAKTHIFLDNMTIYPAWSGGISTMNSIPGRHVCWDEVRLMDLTIGSESNAIKLGNDRLTTYLDYGLGQGYMVSSPSTIGDLLFQQLSVHGTLFLGWQVRCPSCGEYTDPDFFSHVKQTPNGPVGMCPICKHIYNSFDKKREFNKDGKYAVYKMHGRGFEPTKINIYGEHEIPYDYDEHKRLFWRYESCSSPFRSFKTYYEEFLETKDKLHDYKNFVQCWQAKFWIDDKSKTSVDLLTARESAYKKGEVPPWCKILEGGIDSQDDGFYKEIRAFGPDGLTHLVDYSFIPCSVDTSVAADLVKLFKSSIFNQVYYQKSPDGERVPWKVSHVAIDTGGHRTKQIYEAKSDLSNLLMVKGAHDNQNVTVQFSEPYNLYMVRTSEYLTETENLTEDLKFTLPEDTSVDYKNQFCNIRKTLFKNKKNGVDTVVWKKIGQCDYRLACVHSFICLDIPVEICGMSSTVRDMLNDPDFYVNPGITTVVAKAETKVKFKDKVDTGYNLDFNTSDWFR